MGIARGINKEKSLSLEGVKSLLDSRDKESLSSLPLTQPLLAAKLSKDCTLAQYFSKKGLISLIAPSLLTREIMSEYNSKGENCYTYAIKSKTLKDIPSHLLDDDILMLCPSKSGSKDNQDIFNLILHEGLLGDLPKHCFTKRLLLDKKYQQKGKYPRMVQAAILEQIGYLPSQFMDKKTLLSRTPTGKTLLSYIIQAGEFQKLPKELQAEEILLHRSPYGGETGFHIAARFSRLKDIPKLLLTEKNLTLDDEYGVKPIHDAIVGGCLQDIPSNIFKDKHLLKKDSEDQNFFDKLDAYIGDRTPKTIREVYGKEYYDSIKRIIEGLNNKTLQGLDNYKAIKPFVLKELLGRKIKSMDQESDLEI
jgi:hypothetical protein